MNPSITLKRICNGNIDDKINLTSIKIIANVEGVKIKKITETNNPQINSPQYIINNNYDYNCNIEIPNSLDINSPNINLTSYNTLTNSSIKEPNIDENNRKTLQSRIGESINASKFKKSINRTTYINRSINPNPFIEGSLRISDNYYMNKPFNRNITLKELFSGDVSENIILNSPKKDKRLLKMSRYTGNISIRNIAEEKINSNEFAFNSGNIREKNPFKLNIENINLKNKNPVSVGDSITLREIFNGDVNDNVHITQNIFNCSNYNDNNNQQESEDNFDLPDQDDIKNLNEISSNRNAKQTSNLNYENSAINSENNKDNFDIKDIEDLI